MFDNSLTNQIKKKNWKISQMIEGREDEVVKEEEDDGDEEKKKVIQY